MFLYNDGIRRHRLLDSTENYHCTECGNSLTLEPYKDGITKTSHWSASPYVCTFCMELYILVFHDFWSKRYQFIDETDGNPLPEPFGEYMIPEGFLARKVDKTGCLAGVMFNHAGSNCEDKFAFGKSVTTKSPEQIVFDDMDKNWE